MRHLARRHQRGFTLIELVVVMAILGVLISIAVPRYIGARRNALVSEADGVLQELKTMVWAYYQIYGGWSPLPTGAFTVPNPLGFQPPGGGCWDYTIQSSTVPTLALRASANPTAQPRCSPLSSGTFVDLVLNDDGSASRTLTFP